MFLHPKLYLFHLIHPKLMPSMATDLLILLVVMFMCCISNSITESRKELRNKEVNQENAIQLGHALSPNTINPSRELSWQPRVFLYKGFLSDDECDHLISWGSNNKEKSSDNNSINTGEQERTTNLDISLAIKDEVIARVEERISAWTFLPKGNGKPFHVLHFGPEETKENLTYLGNTSMRLMGESLMATVVIYLSNTTQGGQIIFPGAQLGSSKVKNKIWSDCTTSSPITRPIKGNAILFFNLHPNTSLDRSGSHARCPILEGDMWCATKIFVVKSVAQTKPVTKEMNNDDLCTDEDDNCPNWAGIGECERNPIFMVGTADYYGTCRKSCNVC